MFFWLREKLGLWKFSPSIPELANEILSVISGRERQLCQNVSENFKRRVDVINAANIFLRT